MGYSLKYRRLHALEERRLADFEYLNEQVKSKEFAWSSITPDIPGTKPEKMVYDFLVKMGIHFQFQYHLQDSPDTVIKESRWIPDFMLPEYNVVIEVFGHYWHSMPKTEESDRIKTVYMLNNGYTRITEGVSIYPSGGYQGKRYVIWTDVEIYNMGVSQLLARDLPDIAFSPTKRGFPDQYVQNKDEERLRVERQKAAKIAKQVLPKNSPFKKDLLTKFNKNVKKISKRLHPEQKLYPKT